MAAESSADHRLLSQIEKNREEEDFKEWLVEELLQAEDQDPHMSEAVVELLQGWFTGDFAWPGQKWIQDAKRSKGHQWPQALWEELLSKHAR